MIMMVKHSIKKSGNCGGETKACDHPRARKNVRKIFRQTDRQTETLRERERQAERQTDRDRDRERERHTHTDTETENKRKSYDYIHRPMIASWNNDYLV